MAKKQFKTESKRLLDLMANSIYTNTDIFVRELISNASDALDKRHYLALTDTSIGEENPQIKIEVNKKERLFIISDNGIGMDKEELEENLGTIARSGSFEFKQDKEEDEIDIIGQFGVGFYSSFMVADSIEVISKKAGSETAYRWFSQDGDGYEISKSKKEEAGTTITLHLKVDSKEKKYSEYLDSEKIQNLIRKYSDYIRYPIVMDVESYQSTGEEGKSKKVIEEKTINSMTPLWKKEAKKIAKEDYDEFYQSQFYDYLPPLKTIHYKVEGNTSYTALLYIPQKAPYNYYSNDYKIGLKLYSKGVFIKDEAKELVSDYFRFVRGLVDSDDLNLNISREILQEDYQMQSLRKSVDKKIKNTLSKMMEKEREDYEKFFDAFGAQLKYGCYENYGANKDVLIDLLLFKSSKEDKYVSLKEYVERMPEDQKDIYYACGEDIEKIKALPQMEAVIEKGYEVLYFTENIDEFMTAILMNYNEIPFRSINKADLDLQSEEEKQELSKAKEENKDFLEAIKEALNDKVNDVRLSSTLKTYPVCLVSDDGLSLEMEKVLKEMNQGGIKATRILEINKDHPLFTALQENYKQGKDIKDYAFLLYDQALLMAGMPIEDPNEYSKRLSEVMLNSLNK